jgi:polyisoprenoid-binding protein YceI
MDLRLLSSSRAMVDVRSRGIMGALEHELTFTAKATCGAIAVATEESIDVPIEASIDVASIDPPQDASRGDREKMLDNLRGPDTLDMKRWPSLTFRGRYEGSLDRGKLAGDLVVRGMPRRVSFDVRVTKSDGGYRADATWEGTLTDLGIKPFAALFGALKLRDWCRIRLELDLAV